MESLVTSTVPQTTSNGTDVCLVLEGSYPFVFGGVSSWTQNLMTDCSDVSFGVISIRPDGTTPKSYYDPPLNLNGLHDLSLGQGRPQRWRLSRDKEVQFADLLCSLAVHGKVETVAQLLAFLRENAAGRDVAALLGGASAWNVMRDCYQRLTPGASFVQFFWAWRVFFGSVLRVLLAPLPYAKTYHAITTGFAGLLAVRAMLETGRPAILTEHGIYTNERRIDLMLATWVYDSFSVPMTPTEGHEGARDIRDFWIAAFESLAKLCYRGCSEIISLSETARAEQVTLGADPSRTRVVPNGIDVARYADLPRKNGGPPRIALIGRVVAIKDIVTFLRAVALVKAQVPNLEALVVGPDNEDPDYAAHCRVVCTRLGLDDTVRFTGLQPIETILPHIDLVVLTSTSEALPLVLLEAGAAGIACIATDVGACRDVIEGQAAESPSLGLGGRITRLVAPQDTADAIVSLLCNPQARQECGAALRARVAQTYRAEDVRDAYRALYQKMGAKEDQASWQA